MIGAPGSGKTNLLIDRVLGLEDQGLNPGEILVLTPSRLAANHLRDQIAVRSKKAASAARARSISSFAFELARAKDPDLKLLSGAQQQSVIANLLTTSLQASKHLNWKIDRQTLMLSGFQAEVRELLTTIVENQVTEQDLELLAKKFDTRGLRVASDLLTPYRAEVERLGALDPSELLVRALGQFADYQPPKFVFVDDAQDLSPAGLKLVQKLAESSVAYVFGDPDSSVSGFRSGSESFVAAFQSLNRLELASDFDNHARRTLMPRIANRIPVGLSASHRPRPTAAPEVTAEVFENKAAEADWLAAKLRRARLLEKLGWEEMAVIARTRNQLEQLASDLSARSVPVRILGVQGPLRSQPSARSVLDFGALAFGLGEVDREQLLMSSLVGLDALGIKRLLRELNLARSTPRTKALLVQELFEEFLESESYEAKRLNQATELRFRVSQLPADTAYKFVSQVVELMPLERLRKLSRGRGNIALSANRELDAILELIAAAQRFDLRMNLGAKEFVRSQLELAIPEDSLAPIGIRPAVTLATSSQLAGKSFSLVAIPRLQEGIWPNLRPRTGLLGASSLQAFLQGRLTSPQLVVGNELADELRLFYKAIGASKNNLLLSAMNSQDENPSQFFAMFNIELQKNDFGMDFDIRRQVGKLRKQALTDKSALAVLATLALAGVPGAHPKNWQGLLGISTTEPVFGPNDELRLSASKLEAFEKCPLHWFIGTFSGETGSFQASLGTLLHAALEASSQGADLTEYVQSNWHTLEFESQWYSLAQQRRSARMIAMMHEYLGKSDPLQASEQGFEFKVGKLTVAGKIDRIEKSQDGLVVVDLKTGKPPTQAEVLKNRQLALYQVALSENGDQVSKAKIVSIGGDSLKVLEQPALSEEQSKQLAELLSRAADEIGQSEYVARISEHCTEDSSCRLLIAKSVQHG